MHKERFSSASEARLGPYRLCHELGEGAFSRVYLAEDPADGRRVILKAARSCGPATVQAFRQEYDMGARLAHPHMGEMLDGGCTRDGRPYVVLAHHAGEPLAARPAPVPPGEAARLALMLARALEAIHAAGLVHRDVAPANLVLEPDGSLRLIDFGLVAPAGAPAGAGTPLYMAPEALAGDTVGPAADLYGLGAILYLLLTGAAPFEGLGAEALLEAALHRVPPAMPHAPAGLARLVGRLLAKNPADRPGSARAVIEALLPWAEPAGPWPLAPGPWVSTLAWEAWVVNAGTPGLWAFSGETGLGRSRHLREAFARLRRAEVVTIKTHAAPGDAPYALIERLWRWAAALAPEACEALPAHQQALVAQLWPWAYPEVAPCGEARQLPGALWAGLTALLRALAASHPVAVLIDDWERADAASRAVLEAGWESGPGEVHWLVAGAQAPARAQDLLLTPLLPSQVEAWCRAQVQAPLPEGLGARLYEASRGVPGWISQALALWHASGDRDRLAVPESVEALLEAHWGRLRGDQRALAEAFALCEAPLTPAELTVLGPALPETWPTALSGLLADGVLRLIGGSYRFAHGWWADWIRRRLAASKRQALALALARALAPPGGPLEAGPRLHGLARLFVEAGAWPEAIAYCRAAGDESARVFANQTALAHYEAALAAIARDPDRHQAERLALLEACADVWRFTGALEPAIERYTACLAETSVPTARARLWTSLAKCHQMGNQPARAREALEEALRLIEAAPAAGLRLRALSSLGRVLHHLGDRAASQACYTEALGLAQASGERGYEAEALAFLGTLEASASATSAQGLARLEAALAIRRTLADPVGANDAHMLLGNALYALGRFGRARAHFEANLALARQIGHQQEEAFALLNLALCETATGRWHEAAGLLAACRTRASALDDAFLLGLVAFLQSLVCVHLGELAEAEGRAREAREREAALGHPSLRLYGLLCEAERHLFMGAFEPARRALEIALELIANGAGDECAVRAQLLLAEAWLHQGQEVQAACALAAARALMPDEGAHPAGAARLEGWLCYRRGELEQAQRHWAAALAQAEAEGLVSLELQTRLALQLLARRLPGLAVTLDAERVYQLAELQRAPDSLARACLALALARLAQRQELLAERLSRRGQDLLGRYWQALPSAAARQAFMAHPERALFAEVEALSEAHRLMRQSRRLEMLVSLGHALGRTRDPDHVLERMRAFTLDLTQAERCLVLLNDGEGELQLAFSESAPYSRTIVRRVVERREPVCVLDTNDDEGLKAQTSILDLQVRSVMCVPMAVDATLHGVLYVDSRVVLGAFTPDDLRCLVAIANQAAVALDNARLHRALTEQLQRREAYIRRLEESEHVIRHLEELDRLRAGYFEAASHDLRAPLAGINASCQALLKGVFGRLEVEQAETIAGVHQSSCQLMGLIDGILDAAKLEAGKLLLHPQPVALAKPVRDAARLLAALAADKGLALRLDEAALSALPPVLGDERRLHQIALNLIANAIKFTRHGHVAVSGCLEGDRVVWVVADTGPGLPPERLTAPFERYGSSGAQAIGGSGLGLWLVKGLVELHDGTIEVHSEPGRGCTFRIALPLARDAAAPVMVQ